MHYWCLPQLRLDIRLVVLVPLLLPQPINSLYTMHKKVATILASLLFYSLNY